MFRHYLITAFRSLNRQKIHSIINILGLALGLASSLLILLWIQEETSYDRFHENLGSINRVVTDWPKNNWKGINGTPQNLAPVLKEQVPEVLETVRMTGQNRKVFRYKDRAFYESRGLITDPSFFKVFSFPFLQGSAESAFSSPEDMVITESLARKYFGDEEAYGKVIQVEGKPSVVAGVIADIPANSTLRFDYVQSFAFIKELTNLGTIWGAFNFSTFVLLRENADRNAVGPKATEIARENKCPQILSGASFRLQPLSAVHLDAKKYKEEIMALGDRTHVYLFSAVAAFILLLACVNFMNMTTARSTLRAREVGLRKTVGAGKAQLFRQFMGESFVLVGLSYTLALFIALLALPWFNRLSGKNLSPASLDAKNVLMLAALFLVTGLLAGSYPSLLLSAFRPSESLKSRGEMKVGGFFLRRILVVFQFSLTIILLIGTIIIYRQLRFVSHSDLGFDKENVIQLPVKENIGIQYEAFRNRLLQSPHVEAVSAQRYPFADALWSSAGNFDWEGREGREDLGMIYAGVGLDFFETMRMEIKEGRAFSSQHPADVEGAVILNEAAVKAMGMDDPVGKWLSYSAKDKRTIIGIARDVRFRSLHHEVYPRLFYLADMAKADDMGLVLVRIDGMDISGALEDLRRAWESFNTVSPFEYFFLDQTYAELYLKDQRMSAVFHVFTGLAVLISCLGLFGLSAFMAERRTREIGIRKILGAEDGSILMLLSKDFIRWVALANILAWPTGFFLGRKLLSGFVDRIPLEPGIFVISGLSALIVAQLTVTYHALRSARMNPSSALRSE